MNLKILRPMAIRIILIVIGFAPFFFLFFVFFSYLLLFRFFPDLYNSFWQLADKISFSEFAAFSIFISIPALLLNAYLSWQNRSRIASVISLALAPLLLIYFSLPLIIK